MTNITNQEFIDWCIENEATDTFSIMPTGTDPKHYVGGYIGTDKYTFVLVEG